MPRASIASASPAGVGRMPVLRRSNSVTPSDSFELGDTLADRRRRDVLALGGLRHAALFEDRDEELEGGEIESQRCFPYPIIRRVLTSKAFNTEACAVFDDEEHRRNKA